MNFPQSNHDRRSTRLKGYDYCQPGGYFITAVTKWREHLFGEVVYGEMSLNDLGRIVREEWFKSGILRPYVKLFEDEFVVMPNHVHGIIWIVEDDSMFVGTQRRCVPTEGNVHPGSLGAIIRAFKSAVTYRANRELNMTSIWQRNYHDHEIPAGGILRDQAEHERIARYIAANPLNWEDDDENVQQ